VLVFFWQHESVAVDVRHGKLIILIAGRHRSSFRSFYVSFVFQVLSQHSSHRFGSCLHSRLSQDWKMDGPMIVTHFASHKHYKCSALPSTASTHGIIMF
jgi:hypothetical protein